MSPDFLQYGLDWGARLAFAGFGFFYGVYVERKRLRGKE